MMKTTIREVITDNPVLKVKYLKTFKKEYWSINDVKKWNNINCFLLNYLLLFFCLNYLNQSR